MRVDNVIVPQTTVSEKEESVPADSLAVGQEISPKNFRVGLGFGVTKPIGKFQKLYEWGRGVNFHTDRLISDKIEVGG